MTRQQLAKQLRKRAVATGLVTKYTTELLSDDEIINCYNTCNCCGEKFLSSIDLETAIQMSSNAQEFIDRSIQLEHQNKHVLKN